jgi:molybdopterin biosynthesis enzyme
MAEANAYILLDGDTASLEEGKYVQVELFDGLLS